MSSEEEKPIETCEVPPAWATRLCRLERMRALAELSGGLVHDLNNLLASVLGFAEQRLQVAKDPAERCALESFLQSAAAGAVLVQHLGALLAEDGAARESVPLAELVEACARLFRKTAMLEGLAIRTDIAPSAPVVRVVRQDAMHAVLELMLWRRGHGVRHDLVVVAYGEREQGRSFGVVELRCEGASGELERLARWMRDARAGGWSRLAATDDRMQGLAIALVRVAMSGARLDVDVRDGASRVLLRFPAEE